MASLDESDQDVEGSRADLHRLPVDQQLPSLRLNNKPAETTLDQCIHLFRSGGASACRCPSSASAKFAPNRKRSNRGAREGSTALQLFRMIQINLPNS